MGDVIVIVGLALPLACLIVSTLLYGVRWRRVALAALFYALTLPLAIFGLFRTVGSHTDHCLSIILVPIGVALGVGFIVAPQRLPLRRADDRCPRCGYDLHTTPHRCPECGEVLFDRIRS